MEPHRRDGRASRWDAHRARRRADLLRSARKAVDAHGDLSMDDIAAEIGTSKTVLYRYFGDRTGLRRAMGEWALGRIERSLNTGGQGNPKDELRDMIFAFAQFAAGSPNVYRFCDIAVSPDSPFMKGIAELIASRLRLVGPDGLAWSYGALGFIHSAAQLWISQMPSDEMSRDESFGGASSGDGVASHDHLAATLTDWLYASARTLPGES